MRRFTLFIALAVVALSLTFQAVHAFGMSDMMGGTSCTQLDECTQAAHALSGDCLQECLNSGLPETFFAQTTSGGMVFVAFSAFVLSVVFLQVNQLIERSARDAPFGKFDLHKRWACVMIKS